MLNFNIKKGNTAKVLKQHAKTIHANQTRKSKKQRKRKLRSRSNVDGYLGANQESESFVPVPCHHVPYLSQIHWCSTTGRVGPHFQTGLGTKTSVLRYPSCSLTGTLKAGQIHTHSATVDQHLSLASGAQCSTAYQAVGLPLTGQILAVFGCQRCCTWARGTLPYPFCNLLPHSEGGIHI